MLTGKVKCLTEGVALIIKGVTIDVTTVPKPVFLYMAMTNVHKVKDMMPQVVLIATIL